jgi:FkbM family methyltransferase
MLRALAEQATHRVVFRRRLPASFGGHRIYVSSEGGLKYLRRQLADVDPRLFRLADEHVKAGDHVWDIGANLGIFAFAAAVRAGDRGTVLAVEADTWLVGMLRRSAAAFHGGAPVHILPVAIAGTSGIAEFVIASRSRATNHLAGFGSTQTGGARERQLVPCLTLDALAAERGLPDVVKIDVEGAEAEILGSAGKVLEHRPVLILEVTEKNADQIGDLLKRYDYRLTDVATGHAITRPTLDTLAVPA